MLLLQDASGALLLQRRPESGIWGGLWSFPEAEPGPSAWRSLRVTPRGTAQPLPAILHKFTHFDLEISPLLVAVEPAGAVADAPLRWIAADAIGEVGLPRPVQKIIASIAPQEM